MRRGETFGRISWQEATRLLSTGDDDEASAAGPAAGAAAGLAGLSSSGGRPASSAGSLPSARSARAAVSEAPSVVPVMYAGSARGGGGSASSASLPFSIVTVDASAEGSARVTSQPVLFLDVRPAAEWSACRLREAISCPAVLARQDRWPRELQSFKYAEGKGLCLYDSRDDGEAGAIAARLVSTGQYPNVVVLTGGLSGAIAAALTQPSGGRALGTKASDVGRLAAIPASATALLQQLRGDGVASFCLAIAASHLPPHMSTFSKRVLYSAGLVAGAEGTDAGLGYSYREGEGDEDEDGDGGGRGHRSPGRGLGLSDADGASTVRRRAGAGGPSLSAPLSPSSVAASLAPAAPSSPHRRAAAAERALAGGSMADSPASPFAPHRLRPGSGSAVGMGSRGTVAGSTAGGAGMGGAASVASLAAAMGPSSLLKPASAPAGTFGRSSRMAGAAGGVSGGVAMGARGAYHYA